MPPFWRTWSLWLILGSLFGLLLAAIVFVEPVRERFFTIFTGKGDSSSKFRTNVWNAAFKMVQDYPITGIGPGHNSFNKIYPLYQLPRYNALSAYSIFLEVTVETGFIGLACFLWLLIVIFNTAFLQLQRLRQLKSLEGFWLIGAIASLAGMLAHGLVDTVWYRPEVNSVWWLLVGFIASYYKSFPLGRTREFNSPNPESRAS